MNDRGGDSEQRERDMILFQLLKTYPRHRPKSERGEEKPSRKRGKRASAQKRDPLRYYRTR